jgi:hypothetical protein
MCHRTVLYKAMLDLIAAGIRPGRGERPRLAIVVAWLISFGFGPRRLQRTAGEAYPDGALGARAGDGAERDVPRPALGAKA